MAVGFFSLGNCAVSLFILRATHMTSTSPTYITTFMAVALYSIYNISYAFFSLLMGYAAEHLGTKNVLLIGYLLTTGTLIGFMIDGLNTIYGNGLFFITAGLAQACVDTVQKSMAGNLIPEHLHATGYGTLAMVTGIGIFCANSGVGLLWTLFSPAWGFGCAALMTFLGTVMLYTIQDL
jgi:MFS family permease